MAMRLMTFEIPDDVAEQFESHVPASEQSSLVATLLQRASRPPLTEEEWARVCDAANNDPEMQQIEQEMAALPDTMTEDWVDSIEHSETR